MHKIFHSVSRMVVGPAVLRARLPPAKNPSKLLDAKTLVEIFFENSGGLVFNTSAAKLKVEQSSVIQRTCKIFVRFGRVCVTNRPLTNYRLIRVQQEIISFFLVKMGPLPCLLL